MSFIRTDFSPVGGQARRGASPQKFAYSTRDSLATVKANSYFPRDNDTVDKNGMLGIFSPNDIISVVHDLPPFDLNTQVNEPRHSIIRISGDGAGPGTLAAVQNAAGAGYTAGDLIKVTFTDGEVLRNVILVANDSTVSAPTIRDPGLFSSSNVPVVLTDLATVALTGGGNNALTVDLTLTSEPVITVWDEDINDA